jgi:hypothetical protein
MNLRLRMLIVLSFSAVLISTAGTHWLLSRRIDASAGDVASRSTLTGSQPASDSRSSDPDRQNAILCLHFIKPNALLETIELWYVSQLEIVAADPNRVQSIEQIRREVVVIPEANGNCVLLSATPRYFETVEKLISDADSRAKAALAQQSWDEPETELARAPKAEADPTIPTDHLLNELPPRAQELTYLLYWLHTTSVRAFESATRFGSERMTNITLFDDPLPPKHLPMLFRTNFNPYSGQGIYDASLVKGQPAPSEAWMWLNQMQAVTPRGFVYRMQDLRADTVERSTTFGHGFGRPAREQRGRWNQDQIATQVEKDPSQFLVGIPSPSGSTDFHHLELKLNPVSRLSPEDRLWRTQALQLVSLLKHDPPVVYEDRDPAKWESALSMRARTRKRSPSETPAEPKAPTRPLDSIETESLEKLRAGTERVVGWNHEHQRLQMLGAIRAKDRCLKCHDVAKGELLGAFTFWIEELPQGKSDPSVVNQER